MMCTHVPGGEPSARFISAASASEKNLRESSLVLRRHFPPLAVLNRTTSDSADGTVRTRMTLRLEPPGQLSWEKRTRRRLWRGAPRLRRAATGRGKKRERGRNHQRASSLRQLDNTTRALVSNEPVWWCQCSATACFLHPHAPGRGGGGHGSCEAPGGPRSHSVEDDSPADRLRRAQPLGDGGAEGLRGGGAADGCGWVGGWVVGWAGG